MFKKYSQFFVFLTIAAAVVALSAAKPFRQHLSKSLRLASGLKIRSIGTTAATATQTVRLISKHGSYFLQIADDGVVNGTTDIDSPNAKLQIQSVGPGGLVRIYSSKTKRYIAMNSKGILYSTLTVTEDTVFKFVQEESSYHTFASAMHVYNQEPMFLALRKTGQAKKGTKTSRHHKNSLFLEV